MSATAGPSGGPSISGAEMLAIILKLIHHPHRVPRMPRVTSGRMQDIILFAQLEDWAKRRAIRQELARKDAAA